MLREEILLILRIIFAGLAIPFILQVSGDPADPSPPTGPTTSDLDQKNFEKFQKEICETVPGLSGGGATSGSQWSNTLSEKEILELAFVNMANSLTSDSASYMKAELGWKKRVIDMISLITKASCTDAVISESFLNAAKNLFLYYLVKVGAGGGGTPTGGNATNGTDKRQDEWKEIISSLSDCANAIIPIDIATDCSHAKSFSGRDSGTYTIVNTHERLDEDGIGMDYVVDTVWWMFSTTYARCYAYSYPNEDIILLFYQMFKDDFLQPFMERWKGAGDLSQHFSIVFGPYDFEIAAANTRKCCSASYQYEGLEERQLVRPLNVLVDNKLTRNYKM